MKPSQSLSTLSHVSVAPGWIAGSESSQSFGVKNPSPSESCGPTREMNMRRLNVVFGAKVKVP